MKVTEHFQNRIEQIWSDHRKIALGEKIFRKKNLQMPFCCLYVKLATFQKRTNEQIPFDLSISNGTQKMIQMLMLEQFETHLMFTFLVECDSQLYKL